MKSFGRTIFFAALLFLSFILYSVSASAAAGEKMFYARAERPAPVLNTADFRSVFGGRDGKTLKRDPQGLVREIEFIALPGTAFEIESSHRVAGHLIYRVRTADYPSRASGLFVDSRFVTVSPNPFPKRPKIVPPRETILKRMLNRRGTKYVWGGNFAGGIPELLRFYPPSAALDPGTKNMWTLRGLDCSGLLYEAADGALPRNTSDLISFGKPVLIAGLTAERIAARLEPLDLIVWKGHVIIVLDREHTIESCVNCSPGGGVTVRKSVEVLKEAMSARTPANNYPARTSPSEKPFVIRRWYSSYREVR
ncbi:MAG: hypothetical protein BWY42_00747 [Candidatus Omnitrophica bacterium ADurb.Bin277]|nr:MAG: hypothetical protein BWY42_00747 [Candidatus Omnitrophica bacterium ADurb.Bin277]